LFLDPWRYQTLSNDSRYKRGGSRAAEGRQCDKCSLNVVEDEYHVVFDYTFKNSLREDKRFSIFFKGQERKCMIAFTTQKNNVRFEISFSTS
jgi:hypothetical protein